MTNTTYNIMYNYNSIFILSIERVWILDFKHILLLLLNGVHSHQESKHLCNYYIEVWEINSEWSQYTSNYHICCII